METQILSKEQINTFIKDGVLVVENVLSSKEIHDAVTGLQTTLLRTYQVDTTDLYNTGQNLIPLSSTNGSGGVLDIYYESWQIQLCATNPKLFQITTELWNHTYCCHHHHHHHHPTTNDVISIEQEDRLLWYHPYGSFDYHRGYVYLDRIGYRLPTPLAYDIAEKQQQQQLQRINTSTTSSAKNTTSATGGSSTTKKKKILPIQRSLTPHLDCCPLDMYNNAYNNNVKKWRPIQCFIALTDSLLPNHGGFEAAKGFHHDFQEWSQHHNPAASSSSSSIPDRTDSNDTNLSYNNNNNSTPAPCIGEYTHIRPKEDYNILQRVQHIPVKAGSAVFWDNRIPHANAYRNDGTIPRIVIYCSFLPDVPINRSYVKQQLYRWMEGKLPSGNQWMKRNEVDTKNETSSGDDGVNESKTVVSTNHFDTITQTLTTPLARRLAGIDDW